MNYEREIRKLLNKANATEEFCKYLESDGFHFGYDFTLFDE